MLTGRSYGGSRETSSPASSIVPSSGASNPAIIRSVVVLPEPDGPSIVKNSPAGDVEVDSVDRDDISVPLGQASDADVRAAAPSSAKRLLQDGEPLVQLVRRDVERG